MSTTKNILDLNHFTTNVKPQSHISTDVHGSPGSAGSRRIIRAHFGVFERRRSSNDRHDGGKTAATRTNLAKHGQKRQQHGINTAPTRMTTDRPGQSRQCDGPTRQRHGQPRMDMQGPTRRLHGPSRTYTAATRTAPDVAIFPDRHGRTRQFWTSQNCRVGLPEPQEPSRTFQDQQGSPRTIAAATRFTRQIVPDVIRVDPAPIWDWGFIYEKPCGLLFCYSCTSVFSHINLGLVTH